MAAGRFAPWAALLVATLLAAPADRGADLRLLVGDDLPAARAALERLATDGDPAVLPALLAAWPDVAPRLRKRLGQVLRAHADHQPDAVFLDALESAPDGAREAAVDLLANALTRGRTDAIGARLRTGAAARLAPLLGATGRLEACDLLLGALAETTGETRRALIRTLAGCAGFAGRVVPALRAIRPDATGEDLDAILAAARDLEGGRTCAWLVTEALGPELPRLARILDGHPRFDVLLALVRHLPGSRDPLRTLTGLDGGVDPDVWTRRIRELAAKAGDGEYGVPDDGPAEEGGEQPTDRPRFYGIPLPTGPFVLLLDSSGSMGEDDDDGHPLINRVKARVAEVLDALEPQERFNVVFFAEKADALSRHLLVATPGEVRRAKRFVDRVRAGGGTNLGAGLREALRDPDVTDVILLSDGRPSRGTIRTADQVMWLLGDRAVRIHTVSNVDGRALMKEIARRTGGIAREL
jgi:hypothetical protein